MLTVAQPDRHSTAPARRSSVVVRPFSVDEYHALQEADVLATNSGVELLEGLLIERRGIRSDDPIVEGEQQPVHRLTLSDYHVIRDTELLSRTDPCEFIEGLLIKTMIRRPPHDTALGLLHDLLVRHVPSSSIVRNQSAITLTDSEPEPDLAVVCGDHRDFALQHPGAKQTQLVIEIADSSLTLDRGLKLAAYAKHSIPHYWIVNLVDEQIEVLSRPSGLTSQPAYENQTVYVDGQSIPLVLADQQVGLIPVREILP